jgi:tRNA threonylcarbamoyladenosine biosynthesis protein TsaB
MFLLAIDTSGKNGSIALAQAGVPLEDGEEVNVIEVAPLAGGAFSAQLIPQISRLLLSNGLNQYNLGGFAVASGPGSFTGLRVGLAAVKALADVLNKPIAAISLLEISALTSGIQGKIMAALDAGRSEVYVGEYEIPQKPGTKGREYLLSSAEFISQASEWNVVTPDPALAESAAASGLFVSKIDPISAAEVARFGWQKIRSGETVAPDQLEANYIRRSDAEMLERMRS